MNYVRGLDRLTGCLAPLFLCLIVVPAVAAQSTGAGATAGTFRFAGSKDMPLRTRAVSLSYTSAAVALPTVAASATCGCSRAGSAHGGWSARRRWRPIRSS
jgi:hypothetical protein